MGASLSTRIVCLLIRADLATSGEVGATVERFGGEISRYESPLSF
jgi:hypothetical protein